MHTYNGKGSPGPLRVTAERGPSGCPEMTHPLQLNLETEVSANGPETSSQASAAVYLRWMQLNNGLTFGGICDHWMQIRRKLLG